MSAARFRPSDSTPRQLFYEAGVAECYAYDAIGHDPLRQLVSELGLTTVPTHSSAVVLNGAFLRDESEIGRHFGAAHAASDRGLPPAGGRDAAARELAPRLRAATTTRIRGRAARAKTFWRRCRIRSRGSI